MMKRVEYIDRLLDKYFEGQTSLKEEEILRDYFSRKDVDSRHEIYRPMFSFFIEERERLKPRRKKPNIYYWIGAAACIAILITAGIKFQTNSATNKSIMYIDGKKVSNEKTIGEHALKSVINVTNIDEEAIDAQLSVLDMFNGQ